MLWNLWNIRWQGDTRERLASLMRERFAKVDMTGDKGELWVARIEQELALHPIPSPDLPQTVGDKTLNFGGTTLFYRIDSTHCEIEVRDFAEPP